MNNNYLDKGENVILLKYKTLGDKTFILNLIWNEYHNLQYNSALLLKLYFDSKSTFVYLNFKFLKNYISDQNYNQPRVLIHTIGLIEVFIITIFKF